MRNASTCLAIITGASVLAGCAVGPDYEEPALETPAAWTRQLEGGLDAEALAPGALHRWWESLDDAVLSVLIERAVDANLDIRKAASQLQQARLERSRARGLLFPTLGISGAAGEQGRIDRNEPDTSDEFYTAGFDASWEIDVFGGARRANEAARAELAAANEARRDVLVSVLAEVALNFVELRTFEAQLDIARQNLAAQEEARRIVEAQVEEGSATELERQQALSNLAKTRAQLSTFAQSINQTENRLSVLLGQPPGSLGGILEAGGGLPTPEMEIVLGVPADVLRRRPDVRLAERRLAAETARVGVARAALYPKFVLNGSIGIESTSMAGLSGIYNFGPQIQWPIFNAGRLRREIDIQSELQEQALIDYEAAVLSALEEIENSIVSFAEERVRLESLRASATAAQKANQIAEARFEAGMSPFLEVLDAQRTRLAAEDSLAASEGKLVSNLIRIYKALGGGWEPFEVANSRSIPDRREID